MSTCARVQASGVLKERLENSNEYLSVEGRWILLRAPVDSHEDYTSSPNQQEAYAKDNSNSMKTNLQRDRRCTDYSLHLVIDLLINHIVFV